MAVRREKVILELEDQFSTRMAKAAASTALLDRNLGALSGQELRTAASTTKAERSFTSLGVTLDRSGASIDRYSGRLKLIAQSIGALGPGLVPIGASVAPLLSGLTSQLGSAALGAGVLVTAFQGVGDALDAVNEAQLEPTEKNILAAREAMDGLSESAQQAVMAMQELRPVLGGIRDAAAEGVFPGFIAGLEDLEQLAPQVERIFGSVASSAGGLFADGAASLASGEWRGFFDYLEREAGPTLVTFVQTLGNFGKGFAELMMAMDPLTDDFNSGLLGMSQSFEAWAEGVAQTEGFREFVDYVRDTGPQVLDTFGSLADMLLQIAEAASPLGGPVLKGIEAFAKAVAAIADSPAGPTIMGIVAALSAANLAMTAFGRTTQAVMGTAAVGSLRNASTAFLGVASASERASMSAAAFADAERRRQATMRAGLATLGKGAVLMGGMALATSDVGDSLGVTNTAMFAAMGTMAGPWGTAIGAGVGALLDFKEHAGSTAEAIEALRLEMATLADPQTADLSRFRDEIERLDADIDEMLDFGDDRSNPFTGTFDAWGDIFTMATGEYGKAEDALAAARAEYDQLWKVQRGLVEDMSNAEQRRDFFDFVGLGHDARFAAGGIEDLKLQFEGLDAALRGRASMRDYQAAIDAVTESVKRNGRSMDINTEAGRDNQAALDAIVQTSIKVMETLEGAERRAFLVQARKDFRTAAAELNLTKGQANQLLREFGLLGAKFGLLGAKKAKLKVEAEGIGTTLADIGRVRSAADALDGTRSRITIETLHVTTRRDTVESGGVLGGVTRRGSADGGTVPKTGLPYADRHLYVLADGEEVISNRYGQADRNRDLLKAINDNRLADGGTVGEIPGLADGGTARRRRGGSADGVRELGVEAKKAAKAIRREREARQENLKDVLRAARSTRAQIGGSVRDRFRSDIFATNGNVWSAAAADPMAALNADIRAARQLNNARKRLQRKGLGGTALSDLLQNADLGTVRAFSGMSRRELDRFENRYQLRQRVTRVTGRAAGEAVMGAKVDRIERQLVKVNGQLSRLAKDTGKEVASGVNGGARRGVKRGR